MIGSVRGTLLDRADDEVLVEVHGVGYRVAVSPTTSVALGSVGDEVLVWTHHHIREDIDALYGFASADERRCFTALLGAHGVGPALALAILGVHGPTDLIRIVADGDASALCLVPGVGKKTASKLLMELQDRLDVPIDLAASPPSRASAGGALVASPRADVRDALTELGYGPDEIRSVLADLPESDDVSALLRDALSRLASAR